MNKEVLKKIFSGLGTVALLFNSIVAPLTVYSQEDVSVLTEESVLTDEITPTPVESPSPTPEEEVMPSPSPEPEPTIEVTPTPVDEVTLTPTEEVTPTLEEETVSPTPEPTTDTNTSAEGDNSEEVIENPTEPTPTVEPVETEEGSLTAVILEETLAESVSEFDFEVIEEGSATLVTDKPDYAPTDTVVIFGSGFTPDQEYTLEITSETGNFKFSDTVTSDESGSLFYSYQLDGTFRPLYLIEALNSDGEVVASVTFTDDSPASLPFSDSFGSVNSTTVTNWDEQNPAEILTGSGEDSPRAGSPTQQFAKIGDNGWIRRTINASGFQSLQLKYYWKGDSDAENNDFGRVEYCSGATCTSFPGGNLLASHVLNNTSWSSEQTVNLPASLNNSSFRIRFRTESSSSDEFFRVDDVSVTGSVLTQPDLTITKTNDVSGSAFVNVPFTWTLTVTNNGDASATFSNEDIIQDNLPSSGANYSPTSDITVITSGGVTGSIDCDIVSDDDLDCDDNSGGSTVVIPSGGSFSVSITVTPTSVGTLINPRSGGSNKCQVDPDTNESESNEGNNNCSDSVTVSHNIVQNPTLPQVCGVDIALVIDSSGSIEGGELTQIKNAFLGFVSALLPATPTQFSVTEFDTTASVTQSFTSNTTAINNAINAASSGGYTNWEDGLVKAQSTYDPRLDKPNLVLFASDGNPNRVDNGTSVSESQAVSEAVIVANSLKSDGTRVVALGIGNDLDLDNLKAISGPTVGTTVSSDVITSSFDHLAANLAAYASELCGGTITVTKLVDGDGNLQTVDDQETTSGWSFNIGGTDSQTDQDGLTDSVTLQAGTYSVTETPLPDYTLLGASCTGAVNNGSFSGNSVNGIEIDNQSIVSCTFINSQVGYIVVDKMTDPSDSQQSFTFNPSWDNDFSLTDSDNPYESGPIPQGTYSISEIVPDGWDQTGVVCDDQSDPANISLQAGETVTCTFTNTQRGYLIVEKVIIPEGDQTSFEITATGSGTITGGGVGTVSTGSSYDYEVTPGTYSVTETVPGNWDETSNNCDNVVVAPGATANCQIVNTKRGNVTVTKYHDHNADGTQDDGDEVLNTWEIHLDEMSQFTGNQPPEGGQVTFSDLVLGSYTLSESFPSQSWIQSNISCDSDEGFAIDNDNSHPATVAPGQTTNCAIGNYQNGQIGGSKWNDENGNGQFDEESGLSEWVVFIDENGNGQLDSEEQSVQTDQNGNYELPELTPGTYRICEVQQDGWIQTYPLNSELNDCHDVVVTSGDNIGGVDFGNQEVILGLAIEKSNDKVTAIRDDTVTFTLLIVNNSNQQTQNLSIIDVLPSGFTYVTGSSVINGVPAADPTIASGVLTWDIGTLDVGQNLTIVYQAKIATDLTQGTYENLAFCKGEGFSLIRVRFLGDVECDPSASSSVRVEVNPEFGGSAGGASVLGISVSSLPAAGNQTAFLVFALGGLITGIFLKVQAKKYEKN